MMPQMVEEVDSSKKYQFLKPQYIFRYPYTMKSLKWGTFVGAFFSLHTYIKKRSFKKAGRVFAIGTMIGWFPFMAIFMTKHNFYQQSLIEYEKQQTQTIIHGNNLLKLLQYKVGLPSNHNLTEDEIVESYLQTLQTMQMKGKYLDSLLQGINQHTFD